MATKPLYTCTCGTVFKPRESAPGRFTVSPCERCIATACEQASRAATLRAKVAFSEAGHALATRISDAIVETYNTAEKKL